MGARLLKSSNRFTTYSFYPIELKISRLILYICLHSRYEHDFLGAGGGCQNFRIFELEIWKDGGRGKHTRSQTSFVHVPLSRRRRNLCLFDPRDDRSVRSALFLHSVPIIYQTSVRPGCRTRLGECKKEKEIWFDKEVCQDLQCQKHGDKYVMHMVAKSKL